MATGRIGTLRPEDRQAVFSTAERLRLNPYEFGALIHQESGFRPNVYGGAGGNYYGLIQFGGPERAKYLDPAKLGKYTIAEQLPAVERFLLDRGFQPGKMGIDRAYATILGGNPNVSLTSKDSFGTSVASSLPRFKPGGSLYQEAQKTLGDPLTQVSAAAGNQRSVEDILGSTFGGQAKPGLTEKQSIADAIRDAALKAVMGSIAQPPVGLPALPSVINMFTGQ